MVYPKINKLGVDIIIDEKRHKEIVAEFEVINLVFSSSS